MSLTKKISDKKVKFEFNKEFISLFNKKIKENDTNFLNRTLKELHPSDSADIIENLIPENRSKLIELEGFSLHPDIFIELNESIQSEIFILLSTESIVNILKRLESDNALKILENYNKIKKINKSKNLVIGFGITIKTISSLKKADGLVVGSALCKRISESIKNRQNPVTNVSNMVRKLKDQIT